eukprot:4915406-Lingulodinium_polyedra.AAC.1
MDPEADTEAANSEPAPRDKAGATTAAVPLEAANLGPLPVENFSKQGTLEPPPLQCPEEDEDDAAPPPPPPVVGSM